jgi:hypothetical protein
MPKMSIFTYRESSAASSVKVAHTRSASLYLNLAQRENQFTAFQQVDVVATEVGTCLTTVTVLTDKPRIKIMYKIVIQIFQLEQNLYILLHKAGSEGTGGGGGRTKRIRPQIY